MADQAPTINQSLFRRVINLEYSVEGSNGKSKDKTIKYGNIDVLANIADLYAIGSEIASLTNYSVSSIETLDTSKLLKA